MAKEVKIECPKCGWEPDGGAYWTCTTCGHSWNTFDTCARCPKCSTQYEYTQCIAFRGGCPEFSLHEDWYKGLDEWLKEELEKVETSVTETTEA